MSARFILSFCLILNVVDGLSQDYFFRVNHIDMTDGLSFRHATSVVQDDQGFIWIGTRNGLNRFDGYEFTHFSTNSKKGLPSISDNYVHDLDIDQYGNIWIATNTGLDVLNPTKNTIRSYSPQTVFNQKKGINTIDEITITKTSGRIFIHSHQFQSFDKFYNTVEYEQGQFREVSFDDNNHHFEYIANVFEDDHKNLWLRPASRKTFFQVSKKNEVKDKVVLPDSINKHNLINATESWNSPSGQFKRNIEFIRSQEDELNLIGTFCNSHETFIIRGNPKTGFSLFNHDLDIEGKDMPINDFIDKDGDLWMMLNGQILLVSNGQTSKIPSSLINLKDDSVTCFFQSRDGTIWITTNFGVYRVLKESNPFKFYLNTKENEKGYGRSMRAIEPGLNSELYASVVHDGVWKVDRESGKETQLIQANFDNGQKKHAILPYAMHYDAEQLWLCNWFDEGILKFDLKTNQLTHIHCEENMEGFARSMAHDPSGNLLIGTDHGLNVLNIRHEELSRFVPTSNAESLFEQDVSSILMRGNSEIWIGTRENGLFKIDQNKGFIKIIDKENGLSDNNILSLCEYGDYLWVGTASGLCRYHISSGKIDNYTTMHGLPNNQINAIQVLNDNIWLSTNRGLCKFNIQNESGSSYFREDGLIHEEFNYSSFASLKNGNILFGGMNGIVEISRQEKNEALKNPKIILTGFQKSDMSESDGLINSLEIIKNGIDLYHEDRSFSFKFAFLDLFSSKHIKYKYQLEGYDDHWTLLGSENRVRFNKLPPGDYTFKVKALGKDGIWSKHELSIPIRVHRIFYQTWWFISLIVFVTLLLFYLVYRFRINQINKTVQLRVKIASDLHDDVGSMFSQIFIQSDLLSAKVYSEEEEKEEMLKIAQSSREAVNTMSDVVWSIDSRQDTLSDLFDRMKDYSGDALARANILLSFNIEGNLSEGRHLKPQFRQNVYLIFKEAIHNIVKHSNGDQVEISILSSQHKFEMSIKDNGTLSKNEGRLPGQGLRNMEKRATEIGGELQIVKSDGYKVTLIIP